MELGAYSCTFVSTLLFSRLCKLLDRHMSWVKCRLLITLAPPCVSVVLLCGLPHLASFPGLAAVVLAVSCLGGNLHSGSVFSLVYELDPDNAGCVLSVLDTATWTSILLSPVLMTQLTRADPASPHYAAERCM